MDTDRNTNEDMNTDITAQIEQAFSTDRMTFRSFHLVITTSLMFGAMGGLIGWLLSIVAPAYIREVFNTLESEVWQVGLGIGISRGLICGVIVGCSVLVATSWYRSRVKNTLLQQVQTPPE